jgi:DNA repair protein RadD
MELRPYQSDIITQIYHHWNTGAKNVLVQLATGGGKTVTFCKIAKDWKGHSVINAHRVEIVSQISLTLARYGIRHNLIAQRSPIREIVSLHIKEVGASYYDPRARCSVSCVDTLIRLDPALPLFQRTELLIQDEAHHVLRDNKWGKAAALFPNARGLYVTATPCRADGRGLGRGSDGIMDATTISKRHSVTLT